MVWAAHHQHIQQRGGAECECCLLAAGSQRQPWQDHVWPGMLFLGTPCVCLGVLVFFFVYSLLLCFFVPIFGRQNTSEREINRDKLVVTKNTLLLVPVDACMCAQGNVPGSGLPP